MCIRDSRRNVSISKVRELVQTLDSQICPVGVFVDKDCGEVVQLLNEGTIQIAQLHEMCIRDSIYAD